MKIYQFPNLQNSQDFSIPKGKSVGNECRSKIMQHHFSFSVFLFVTKVLNVKDYAVEYIRSATLYNLTATINEENKTYGLSENF